MCVLDRKMDDLNQKSRSQNVQIDGIPQTNGENLRDIILKLATVLKVPVSADDITRITRVQSTNGNKCKPIICVVNKPNLLADLAEASRKLEPNMTSIGVSNDRTNIFVNSCKKA